MMRTNIEIDDELIERALGATGLKTKRAAVEEGLRALIRLHEQRDILDLAGKVQWSGDLDESRQGRNAR
jgi:Arc/MetJ family transcription regulator